MFEKVLTKFCVSWKNIRKWNIYACIHSYTFDFVITLKTDIANANHNINAVDFLSFFIFFIKRSWLTSRYPYFLYILWLQSILYIKHGLYLVGQQLISYFKSRSVFMSKRSLISYTRIVLDRSILVASYKEYFL